MPMTSAWSRSDFMLMWTMWAVMMAAMMHAAATPMVSAYARTVRSPRSSVRGSIPGFVDGYIAVWSGFALLATGLQWVLHDAALVNAMGSSTSRWLAGPAVPTSSPRSSTRCSSDAVHLSASCWSTGVNRPPHHQRDTSASRWPTQRRCLPNLPPHMIPIRCCSTAWARGRHLRGVRRQSTRRHSLTPVGAGGAGAGEAFRVGVFYEPGESFVISGRSAHPAVALRLWTKRAQLSVQAG